MLFDLSTLAMPNHLKIHRGQIWEFIPCIVKVSTWYPGPWTLDPDTLDPGPKYENREKLSIYHWWYLKKNSYPPISTNFMIIFDPSTLSLPNFVKIHRGQSWELYQCILKVSLDTLDFFCHIKLLWRLSICHRCYLRKKLKPSISINWVILSIFRL